MRNALFGWLVGLLGLAVAATGGAAMADPADEAMIGETFVAARTALQDQDGAAAVATLSRATRERVEDIRTAALAGTRAALAPLSPAERFAALGLRHHMTPAEIRARDAAGLAEHALAQGWLGPNIIRQAGLGRVSVRGDRATGTLVVDGQPVLVPAGFVREEGTWRIDLDQTLAVADALIGTTAALSKKTEDEVVSEMLLRLSGRPVAPLR